MGREVEALELLALAGGTYRQFMIKPASLMGEMIYRLTTSHPGFAIGEEVVGMWHSPHTPSFNRRGWYY
jgi:hypothetical protein